LHTVPLHALTEIVTRVYGGRSITHSSQLNSPSAIKNKIRVVAGLVPEREQRRIPREILKRTAENALRASNARDPLLTPSIIVINGSQVELSKTPNRQSDIDAQPICDHDITTAFSPVLFRELWEIELGKLDFYNIVTLHKPMSKRSYLNSVIDTIESNAGIAKQCQYTWKRSLPLATPDSLVIGLEDSETFCTHIEKLLPMLPYKYPDILMDDPRPTVNEWSQLDIVWTPAVLEERVRNFV
ncbi:hypothetical protein KBD81_03005, partial [Candidatus Woesebacteria bacterium]|nr:hypothetical protein [Candidatus Woesebacteria bacterium]